GVGGEQSMPGDRAVEGEDAGVGDRCKRFVEGACDHYDSACFTRSGENGTRRSRTPVASKMALAMAAATGRIDGSPAPVGGSSGWLIKTTLTSAGVSVMSRIG